MTLTSTVNAASPLPLRTLPLLPPCIAYSLPLHNTFTSTILTFLHTVMFTALHNSLPLTPF